MLFLALVDNWDAYDIQSTMPVWAKFVDVQGEGLPSLSMVKAIAYVGELVSVSALGGRGGLWARYGPMVLTFFANAYPDTSRLALHVTTNVVLRGDLHCPE